MLKFFCCFHRHALEIPGGLIIKIPKLAQAELKRLNKELETAQKQLDQVNAKLNNPGFTGKAPANVVEGARQNAQKLEDKIKMIASSIEALNG